MDQPKKKKKDLKDLNQFMDLAPIFNEKLISLETLREDKNVRKI